MRVLGAIEFAPGSTIEFDSNGAVIANGYPLGDFAHIEDGDVCFDGRATERIITSGFTVFAPDVEEKILSVPGVDEVAVIGMNSEVRDQVIYAYWAGEATEEDIKIVIKELPFYAVPKEFIHVEKLPRNPSGKVMKGDLING